MDEILPEPVYFGPTDAPIFGWWHPPISPSLDTGVILCASFGREEVSAHRSLRELARRLAKAGLPVVRFDYAGSGDSSGDERGKDVVHAWTGSVDAAADELKRLSGVTKIAIVGLRLGVMLGWQAALGRTDVTAFVAIAAVLSGRAFVRELKVLQAASSSVDGLASNLDILESGGFVLNATTRDAILAMDLRSPDRAPAAKLLVIDRDDLPAHDPWVANLRKLGCRVEHRRLPGYVEMMQDPHRSSIPSALLDAAAMWLASTASSFAVSCVNATPLLSQTARLPGLNEQAVWVEADAGRLSGVIGLPTGVGKPSDAVLLLNAGATRRTGPSRMYVDLARLLARRGYAVLRLDISGLGDSGARAGAIENVVYSQTAIDEVACAARYMRDTLGVERCQAVGMCSGAYHAFKAAVRGVPLNAVVAINPLTFFWNEGSLLETGLKEHQVVMEMARYRSDLLATERWLRLARGEVVASRLVSMLWKGLISATDGPRRDVARRLQWPLKDDLALEVQAVISRGTSLKFVVSDGDPGEQLLRMQGGALVRQMLREEKITMHRVANGDHTFTRLAPRTVALALISELIGPEILDPHRST